MVDEIDVARQADQLGAKQGLHLLAWHLRTNVSAGKSWECQIMVGYTYFYVLGPLLYSIQRKKADFLQEGPAWGKKRLACICSHGTCAQMSLQESLGSAKSMDQIYVSKSF